MEMPVHCSGEEPSSSQGCQSCFRLQKELKELKDKLYHKPRLVPEQLWDIIPPAGNYIKNIMKFSGYETIDSVATLKRKDELDKMFRFVRSMSEIVEDKSQIFGIFSKNPQRVMVIPGLEPAVNKFLSAVDKLLKAEGTDLSKQSSSNPVSISPLNSTDSKCYTSPLCTPSPISWSTCRDSVNPYDISNVISRMEQWIVKQPGAVDILQNLGLEPVNVFRITENEETKDYHFECLICNKHISMQTVSRKGVSLSNAMRHITRICWLTNRNKDPNLQPAKFPKLRANDQKPISNFSDRNFFDETARCSFVLGDVEEASGDTQNSDQSDSQKSLILSTDQEGHAENVAAVGDAP